MHETIFTHHPIDWLNEDDESVPNSVLDWLQERGSMTKRFEQHCQKVTVIPYLERYITPEMLSADEAERLPESQRYWLREVIMYGDNIPWLIGRTLIPEETLTNDDKKLVDIGRVPLGRYLFSHDSLTRDYIDIGTSADRWVRRSLLRLSQKPLLLTEIFLPESPAYR
ncbi:Chorismate--pyruvate lyase [Providencia rustigianii]|uniref:Chorismate pyruvate-lyase n=2 Tax=Providencia rustigianii TaxID=158850 RepID=D1P752_9GAMM|nr:MULTISPECIES: chorismate lyase [Providencia]EFB70899.1 chorismate lyase [Providencia rustigianii DSM 4541]MTC56277.1 chorismate lyase [Providencia rustigianii]MTC59826.1 chorismate lyase [Providencia rustigianii]SPY76336.1 Chorismate--pyruvate lyase [Providencia rustigianii]SUC25529.1 Chorismate--pyruvate lyase [Providencia rustigianii]